MFIPFLDLLVKFIDTSPSVTRIVSDDFVPVAVTGVEQLGIPLVLFYTIPACAFMSFKQFSTLVEKLARSLPELGNEIYRKLTN